VRPEGVPRILNIGNNESESVSCLVRLLEAALGRKAMIESRPRPLADVEETFADISQITELTGFLPRTPLAEGIGRFAAWFQNYHRAK
jgi:UDP-glucuronate 4-epimerase